MAKKSLQDKIEDIRKEERIRIGYVLDKVLESKRKDEQYDRYLTRLSGEKFKRKIEQFKQSFSEIELKRFILKSSEFTKIRKERLLLIIDSKLKEFTDTKVDYLLASRDVTFEIKQKYGANPEIIHYYLYEQNPSKELRKVRSETPVVLSSKLDEFSKAIKQMREENIKIDSLQKYLSMKLINEYSGLEIKTEKIRKQIKQLSEMRVFLFLYFELIPKVLDSLPDFTLIRNDANKKDSTKLQLKLLQDFKIDVFKLAYFYITENIFRDDFAIEYHIITKEIEEKELALKYENFKRERENKEIEEKIKENFIPEFAEMKNLKPKEINITVDYLKQGKELTIEVRGITVKGGFELLDLYSKKRGKKDNKGKPTKDYQYLIMLLESHKFKALENADFGSEEKLTSRTREFNNLFRRKFPIGKQRVIDKKQNKFPEPIFHLD